MPIKKFFSKAKTWFAGTPEVALTPSSLTGLAEPTVQQALSAVMVSDLLRERRADRRWRMTKRAFFVVMGLCGLAYYMALISRTSALSFSTDTGKFAAVVRVEGEIGSNTAASADKIIPVLRRAMEDPKAELVIISIDSGGGAPVEAERIGDVIDQLQAKHSKPVVAAVQGIGASAAYLLALHTDKIYAARFSMVGSIGAVMSSWDVHKAINRYDVRQDVYASGGLKAMLNPFVEQSPEARAKAQDLVDIAGKHFGTELQRMRGSKLQAGVNYTSGAVWGGIEAQQLGLADELATLDEIANTSGLTLKEYGPGRRTVTPFSFYFDGLSQWVHEAITQSVASALYDARLPRLN